MQNFQSHLVKYRGLVASILIVPLLSLYGFGFSGYESSWYSPSFTSFASFAFILIFGTFFIRNETYGNAFFASGLFLALFLTANGIVYSSSDYATVVKVALGVSTVGVIFGIVALFLGASSIVGHLSESFRRILSGGEHKVVNALTQIVLLGIILWVSYGIYLFNHDQTDTNFKFFITFAIRVLMAYFIAFSVVNVIHHLITTNWRTISSVFSKLDDTSINTYLTRTISSWIYAVARWATFVSIGYAVAANLSTYAGWPQLWIFPLALPFIFLAGYLVLMVVRIVIEYSNALIHVAENTAK